jgi:energy-coupling factor transporter ATP-binding protein EcfA2
MPRHTTLGTSNRGELTLSLEDRLRHIAIIGSTGAGKSTLLRHLINQDLHRGDGCILLDPMGDLSEAVLGDVPEARRNQVCYLNVADLEWPVGLNVLQDTSPDDRARVVDGVVNAMESIWFGSWGPRMEQILRHACSALIETPNGSLALLPRFLTDDAYRASIVARLTNHDTRLFFGRFDQWKVDYREIALDPVLNKVETFLSFPNVKRILAQRPSTLHLDYAIEHQRIVIVNLAMGTVGETAARLMGALILATVRAAAMARARIPPAERRPFHVYVDEAHSYGPASFSRLLSEIRQFRLSIAMSTQYLDGLSDSTRAALLGNAKTLAAFRCGPGDARILAQNFNRLHEEFNETALLELDDGEAFVAAPGREGIRVSIPPPAPIASSEQVKKQSRRHYGRPRASVERYIERQLGYHIAENDPARSRRPGRV